ncbi:Alpha/Beta hydrolase protein [Chytriomyces sp. MP71]|nr:Alpha/Beta hydrolase protein [Chytriomyces sp. MP71]
MRLATLVFLVLGLLRKTNAVAMNARGSELLGGTRLGGGGGGVRRTYFVEGKGSEGEGQQRHGLRLSLMFEAGYSSSESASSENAFENGSARRATGEAVDADALARVRSQLATLLDGEAQKQQAMVQQFGNPRTDVDGQRRRQGQSKGEEGSLRLRVAQFDIDAAPDSGSESDSGILSVASKRGRVPKWSSVSRRSLASTTNKHGDPLSIAIAHKDALLPDSTDKETVLALARMTSNSYTEPGNPAWVDIPPYNISDRFGWNSDGIRGYVFTDDARDLVVIALKGTSLTYPIVGGGPTAPRDKFNDNLMFSCCCGKVSSSWQPVCDCADSSTSTCDMGCLYSAASFSNSYFNLANTIYMAVTLWYPSSKTIWLTGHSLGGALASLVGLTHDLPVFAYEAPGDFLYAFRIGLIPDLPPAPDKMAHANGKSKQRSTTVSSFKQHTHTSSALPAALFLQNGDEDDAPAAAALPALAPPSTIVTITESTTPPPRHKDDEGDIPTKGHRIADYAAYLETLHIYHIGNWKDPIYTGECLSSGSLCWIAGYALESKCHSGFECVYEGLGSDKDMRYHSIDKAIEAFFSVQDTVPPCKVKPECEECGAWTWKV